jgi:hypothetical protein
MTNRAVKLYGSILIALFILTSCAPTRLTKVWKDDAYTGGPVGSVLVVGVSDNLANRKIFEQHFTGQFRQNGVKAFPSYDVISQDKELNKDTIKNTAEELGAATVLVTHLVGVEEKEEYMPPAYTSVPTAGNMHLGRYYDGVYSTVHTPGYYVKNEYVRLENNLYETKTETLIWSSSSETVNPESVFETIETLCKVVMKSLQKSGLIK